MPIQRREKLWGLRRIAVGLACLVFFALGALTIAPVRAIVCSYSSGFQRDANGFLCTTDSGAAMPTPIPYPTSTPGGTLKTNPADSTGASYTLANPLPVTTPPPFIPANPLPVTTPAPFYQNSAGSVRAEACDKQQYFASITAPTPIDAGTLGPAMHICEMIVWAISGTNPTASIVAGGNDGTPCHGGEIVYISALPLTTTPQVFGSNVGQLVNINYNTAQACLLPGGTGTPTISGYVTYDLH